MKLEDLKPHLTDRAGTVLPIVLNAEDYRRLKSLCSRNGLIICSVVRACILKLLDDEERSTT